MLHHIALLFKLISLESGQAVCSKQELHFFVSGRHQDHKEKSLLQGVDVANTAHPGNSCV